MLIRTRIRPNFLKFSLSLFLLGIFLQNGYATVYTVNALGDAGAGAGTIGDIRYCINTANGDASAGPHQINFAILPAGQYSIALSGGSFTIIRDMIIDATTQPGYVPGAPTPMIELKNSASQAFVINSGVAAAGTTIKGFAINNCSAQGILIQSPNNKIKGCYIGTNLAGTAAVPNHAAAILINGCCGFNASGNIFGGITVAERNIISGNLTAHGLEVNTSSNNVVIGNYIGLDKTGTVALANAYHGVNFYGGGNNNKVGGITTDSANVVSANGQGGVYFANLTNSRIIGNLIGTAATGFTDMGNNEHGILISACTNILVFGNTVSGNNQIGINSISNGTTIVIKKNYVGTSSDGLSAIGNSVHGIQVQGSTGGIVIGGNRLTEGNIISNSGIHGINLDPGADNSIIKGNIIGSDINGTAFFGNGVIGFVAKSNNLIIGGTSNNEGNIIVDSRNTAVGCGLLLANASNAIVRGNLIGLGLTLAAMPNFAEGINISVENLGMTATNNKIEYNTIAYNLGHGVNVGDALPIVELGAGGTVSNNDEFGNYIRYNSIYCNVMKGISLNKLAASIPDRGNADKATPVVNTGTSTSTFVNGTASPNDSIHIYVMSTCSNCNTNPQGKTFVAAVKADGAGLWSYTSGSAFGGSITVTATDASNNTSEFATCLTLPVELVSLKAETMSNQSVLVSWVTAMELNNDHFEIERSANGSAFQLIGTVKGAGNFSGLLSYSFQDNAPETGTNYYRLKQVDFNGHFEYSSIVAAAITNDQSVQIFPNPASSEFSVLLKERSDKVYKIAMTDLLGKTVREISFSSQDVLKVDTKDISEGQYVLKVTDGLDVFIQRVEVAK